MKRTAEAKPTFLLSFIVFSVALLVLLLYSARCLEGAEGTDIPDRVYDPQAVASFVPPHGWIRWDFWGVTAFSPTIEHTPRLTFAVTVDNHQDERDVETVMKDYVRTFSTENYTLIRKEYLYVGGYSGVRVLARGTENNRLFDRDFIWIQEYDTGAHKITLTLHSDEDSFETYQDRVLESFRSLIIVQPAQDE